VYLNGLPLGLIVSSLGEVGLVLFFIEALQVILVETIL
jgi:hypothetical protein